MGAGQREGLLLRVAEADAGHVGVAPRNEGQQHRAAVHIEEDAVDGLDLDGGRMDVGTPQPGTSGRDGFPAPQGSGWLSAPPSRLWLRPANGCRRPQPASGALRPWPGDTWRRKSPDCPVQPVQHRSAPASQGLPTAQPANVAAALHQLALVQLFQLALSRADGLDEGAAGVVGQHHDMGRFQRRTPAHGHAGRDALGDGALTGPDGRAGTLLVAVSLEVYLAHEALTHPAALLGALDVDKAVHGAGQHVAAVLVHGGVDVLHPLGRVFIPEVDLRQDEPQGAGAAAG